MANKKINGTDLNTTLFGNILIDPKDLAQYNTVTYDYLVRLLNRPNIKPRYRISVLNPDESVKYIIPDSDIVEDGISYTEEYQNGQRRNVTLDLINTSGRYTPALNGLWVDTRFRLDIGINYRGNDVLWFPKGVYIMGNIDLTYDNSDRQVTIQLQDKYAIFEGRTGTLEVAYEVEAGATIIDAVRGVLNFALGNGYVLDYKDVIFDPSFVNAKTQTAVRAEEGGNLGEIIDGLATQLSAEYYYNNVGNLCFYPINETVNDDVKPIIWTFDTLNRNLHNMSLSYDNENVTNIVKVVGDNIDSGVCSAVVSNNNPASPICVENIGRRMAPTYSESNVWNDDLAGDLARYYLRKASFVSVSFNSNVSFNPVLEVNNLVEVDNEFLNYHRTKLLITSISFTSDTGLMSVAFCNVTDLPFTGTT